MFSVIWCYVQGEIPKVDGVMCHLSETLKKKGDKSLLWGADDFQRVRQIRLALRLSVALHGVKDKAGFKELQRLL